MTTNKVRMVTIDAHHDGQRIDNYLMRELKGAPRNLVYRILRKGEVRVNKGRIKPTYRLQAGDLVRIPPVRLGEDGPAITPGAEVLQLIQQSILHEDDNLLIINKPSGLAVHAGSGVAYGVIEAVRAMRPHIPFIELVHRIDRDTSGCLMMAKNRETLLALHDMLRDSKQVEKNYLALLCGAWQGGKRTISAPLRKNAIRGGERMVEVHEEGKAAISQFRPVTRFTGHTLVEVGLETGRTHQIRVHAAYIGHPLAGDTKYGDADCNRGIRQLGLRRLFLHAHLLVFTLPGSDKEIHVSAPLPVELGTILEQLTLA